MCEVEILKGAGGHTPTHFYQTPNSHIVCLGVSNREQFPITRGKQPRPPDKVPNYYLVGKVVELFRQLGGWLRSSHPLKKA